MAAKGSASEGRPLGSGESIPGGPGPIVVWKRTARRVPISRGIKPPELRRTLQMALVRKPGRPPGSENSRGGAGVGNFTRISGRHNALKVKAQERFRDETSSVVVKGGLRAGSPRASKRCGRILEGCGSLSIRVPFAMHALKSPKVHGGCCFRRSVPAWPLRCSRFVADARSGG